MLRLLRAGLPPAWVASAIDRAIPRFRRIARENLARVSQRDDGQIDEVFRSIARILVAFAHFPDINRSNVDRWIRMEGIEHVREALAVGRGVIFATGHLGNWELSAFAFALLERPISVVVRPFDNRLLDRFADRYRTMSGNRTIGKRDYVRGILEALHRNEMVGILTDQHDQNGIAVDFFGVPALSSPGIARIAAKSGAAVIPGFAIWSDAESKYVLRFYPPVAMVGDVHADTQAIQEAIETAIREHPGQWLWIHRRWKT